MIKLATPSWRQVSSVLVQRANGSEFYFEVDSWMVEDVTASELLDDLKVNWALADNIVRLPETMSVWVQDQDSKQAPTYGAQSLKANHLCLAARNLTTSQRQQHH